MLEGTDRAILVADEPDRGVVGYVALLVRSIPATAVRDARTFVEIDQLYVDDSARRLGVGRALVQAAKRWASDRDITELEVSAWSFNRDTIAFYHRLGFHPTVERFAMMVE